MNSDDDMMYETDDEQILFVDLFDSRVNTLLNIAATAETVNDKIMKEKLRAAAQLTLQSLVQMTSQGLVVDSSRTGGMKVQ
ncbi:hypothetical protein IRY61_02120 [Candidatus Saccharibacteria bacterium]|nr:hypothetical protein [Candidatus Saccharibacteria bacterium]